MNTCAESVIAVSSAPGCRVGDVVHIGSQDFRVIRGDKYTMTVAVADWRSWLRTAPARLRYWIVSKARRAQRRILGLVR